MGTFTVHGECNYESQRKVISQTFSHELEIPRELYANSHDAGAGGIHVYPRSGGSNALLVWLDDGSGMDNRPLEAADVEGCRGHARTSLQAYFHIGNSTRRPGHGVGQFCHGQKLVLAQADVLFGMLTRTAAMPPGVCWAVTHRDVFAALEGGQGLELLEMPIERACAHLRAELRAVDDSVHMDFASTLDDAAQRFASLASGTMQVFVARGTPLHTTGILNTDPSHPGAWAAPKKQSKQIHDDIERTVLVGCLRFGTRHGTTLSNPGGHFDAIEPELGACEHYRSALRKAALYIHARETGDGGYRVPYGFPFIQMTTPPSARDDGGTLRNRTSLWARFGPRRVASGSRVATVKLAIDSIAMRLVEWEALQRSNLPSGKRCGIPLQRFSGLLVSVQGVPVLREHDRIDRLMEALPVAPKSNLTSCERDEYAAVLNAARTSRSDQNAVLIVDFHDIGLRTDRNDLTPDAYEAIWSDETLLFGIANVLHEFCTDQAKARRPHVDVLLEVMKVRMRTVKEVDEKSAREYAERRVVKTLEARRMSVTPRPDAPDAARALLAVLREEVALPCAGHEVHLQHLYAHVGTVVRALCDTLCEERYPVLFRLAMWWYRVGLLFSDGVDAQVFQWSHKKDAFARSHPAELRMDQVEVKMRFGENNYFSHPFVACDLVVCAELAVDVGEVVTDSQKNNGVVCAAAAGDELHGVGCYISDITCGPRRVTSRRNPGKALVVPIVFFDALVARTLEEVACVQVFGSPTAQPEARQTTTRSRRGAKRPRKEKV
jgi:hypothetical protein